MEQSQRDGESPTADEIAVAEILIDLPRLIIESESRCRLSPWGGKRKRSIPVIKTASPSSSPPLNPAPPPPPEKLESSSPASPLAFLPSELEENQKPKPLKKKSSFKERREEQLQKINELSQRKDLLHKDIENVKIYYEKLKSYNSALKSRKQELIGIGVKGNHEYAQHSAADHHRWRLPPPCHQPAEILRGSDKSGVVVWDGVRDNVGPTRIFDLNVAPPGEVAGLMECYEPLDRFCYRARAAVARLKRKQICKMKNSTAICKPRVNYR